MNVVGGRFTVVRVMISPHYLTGSRRVWRWREFRLTNSIISQPHIGALIFSELISRLIDGLFRSVGGSSSSPSGCARKAGLLSDFGQCLIHGVRLYPGVVRIQSESTKGDNLNPSTRVFTKLSDMVSVKAVFKTTKEVTFMILGVCCLIVGWL